MVADYRIRNVQSGEMNLLIEWAREEGWNPGLHDGTCFHAADPKGFLVAEVDGRPVGTISAVSYGGTFGFIGFYIVRKGLRDHGYGMPLARAALRYLKDCNAGMDGVLERVDAYAKIGFTLAFRNFRFEGVGGGSAPRNLAPLNTIPFAQVSAYDRECFPAPRTTFLEHWISQPGTVSLACCESGVLKGYGVIRPCFHGHKIGPLFADSMDIAENLFQGLAASVPGQTLYLDTPEPNQQAVNLAKKHGMNLVFSTARMYSKGEPEINMNRIFGVTSFELG